MPRDLIVHLDGSSEDETRLGHAEAIAKAHGAHVAGLYTNLLPEYFMATGFDPAFSTVSGIVELQERLHEEGQRTAQRLRDRLAKLDAPSEFRSVEGGASELNARCASEARLGRSLRRHHTVRRGRHRLGRDDRDHHLRGGDARSISRRPAPSRSPASATHSSPGATTREAARARSPKRCPCSRDRRPAIVTVRPKGGEELDPRAGRRRRPSCPSRRKGSRSAPSMGMARRPAGALLGEARRIGADLIVMGAYGHSRFREWVLGRASRAT